MSIVFIVAALLVGILIGALITRRFMLQEVKKAYDTARQEFEQKKTEISDKIGDQLSDMRHGLIRTLEAYVGAVSVVRENLPISAEKLGELIAPAKLKLSRSDRSSSVDQAEQEIAVEIDAGIDSVKKSPIQPIMSESVADTGDEDDELTPNSDSESKSNG
jgi:hypothetical protein